jgi:hypothetical protein
LKLALPIAAALTIAANFLTFAGDGLSAYFTPDDMMNLYGAWFRPLVEQDRPLGTLVYRGLFAAFGLDPLPYRVLCFALLSVNLVLLYLVSATLSASREVGALACLLGAYHAHLADLYYNTGTLYDLLCFAFYWSAIWLWTRSAPKLSWLVLALYVLALASKEMALTLPLVLLAYDLLYRSGPALRPSPRDQSTRQWIRREAVRLAPFGLITAAFVLIKIFGARKMLGNPSYLPQLSWTALIEGWKHYAFDLLYGAFRLNTGRVLLLWIVLAAAALLLRKRDTLLALAVIWAGLLPIIFIAPRGFYVIYLTLPGWYLLVARLLVTATSRVRLAARAPVLFATAAILLLPLHAARKEKGRWWVAEAHRSVKSVLEPLRSETLPHAARVLFLADPFPREDYVLTFIFRLRFRDDDLRVDRARVRPVALAESYDRAYRLEAGTLIASHP